MFESLKGKCVLIFGEPATGKSYALANLGRKTYEAYGKKAYFIWSDVNLMNDYGKELSKFSNAEIYKVNNVHSLLKFKLPSILTEEKFDYSFLSIDSISGLEEQLTVNEKLGSPRRNLLLSQLCRTVTYFGSMIAKKFNIPVFTVAHSTPLFEESWRNLNVRPAFARRGIKNNDVIIYHYIKDKEIYWKIVMWRSLLNIFEGREFKFNEILNEIKRPKNV